MATPSAAPNACGISSNRKDTGVSDPYTSPLAIRNANAYPICPAPPVIVTVFGVATLLLLKCWVNPPSPHPMWPAPLFAPRHGGGGHHTVAASHRISALTRTHAHVRHPAHRPHHQSAHPSDSHLPAPTHRSHTGHAPHRSCPRCWHDHAATDGDP